MPRFGQTKSTICILLPLASLTPNHFSQYPGSYEIGTRNKSNLRIFRIAIRMRAYSKSERAVTRLVRLGRYAARVYGDDAHGCRSFKPQSSPAYFRRVRLLINFTFDS